MLAPIMILLARLVQGFAIGGEMGASTALLLEYADDRSRGFYTGWQPFSARAWRRCSARWWSLLLGNVLGRRALEGLGLAPGIRDRHPGDSGGPGDPPPPGRNRAGRLASRSAVHPAVAA
ncbi:hypothetical protein ACU4GD_29490 [Cupriavidus basilensis]